MLLRRRVAERNGCAISDNIDTRKHHHPQGAPACPQTPSMHSAPPAPLNRPESNATRPNHRRRDRRADSDARRPRTARHESGNAMDVRLSSRAHSRHRWQAVRYLQRHCRRLLTRHLGLDLRIGIGDEHLTILAPQLPRPVPRHSAPWQAHRESGRYIAVREARRCPCDAMRIGKGGGRRRPCPR